LGLKNGKNETKCEEGGRLAMGQRGTLTYIGQRRKSRKKKNSGRIRAKANHAKN